MIGNIPKSPSIKLVVFLSYRPLQWEKGYNALFQHLIYYKMMKIFIEVLINKQP